MFNWKNVKKDGDNIILEKISGVNFNSSDKESYLVSFLDLETNGLDYTRDEIIEIGIITYEINSKGQLVKEIASYESLQEIEEDLKPKIENITGLKKEDLKGNSIEWDKVKKLLEKSDYIIAHNANFDRNFLESKIGDTNSIWGCSLTQIDWYKHGFTSKSLPHLCISHGFYYDGHRAINDIEATAYLLQLGEKTTYLRELLDVINEKSILVITNRHKQDKKNVLKENDYYWSADIFSWTKNVSPENLDKELNWLAEKIYDSGVNLSYYIEYNPEDSFKNHKFLLDKYGSQARNAEGIIKTLKVSIEKSKRNILKERSYRFDFSTMTWDFKGSKSAIKEELNFLKNLNKKGINVKARIE